MKTVQKIKARFIPMPGTRISSQAAELVGSTMLRLTEDEGGVKPDSLVREARPASSPLHSFFTWDNNQAGEQYRLFEARQLIRSVRIIVPQIPAAEQPVIRAFYSVTATDTEEDFSGRAYLPVAKVHGSVDYTQQVLNTAKKQLNDWAHRYEDLRNYFGGVFPAIDRLRRTVRKPKTRAKKGK